MTPHYRSLLTAIFLLFTALLWQGCKKELRPPTVENELLVPLVKSDLTIDDIINDSLRTTGNDGLVTLAYRSALYSGGLESFAALETREFEQIARLQSLNVGSQTAVRAVSLGQVATESGPLGAFIISQNGNNTIIPPLTGLSYGPLDVDGSSFFETVTLDSGYMDVTIQNNFPTGVSNVLFEIRNQGDNALIGQETFANVPQGTMQTRTIDLAGKTVEGLLAGDILNFDIDGSGGAAVLIDTTDQIIVTILVRDTKVRSATAIFPSQDVITLFDTAALQNVGDVRGRTAIAATGFVDLRVVSTVEDTLFFNYRIPRGIRDGDTFEIQEKIPPAPPGGSIERVYAFDVSGYTFDLTGMPIIDHYNAFYSELTGRIDSTGQLVNLSLSDSILMYVKLRDFVPEYIEGYLGNFESAVGPDEVPIDLFSRINDGALNFSGINLSLSVENENGAPFQVDIQSIEGFNSSTGNTQLVDLSDLPNPLVIEQAPDLSTSWASNWRLTGITDNLNALINLRPDILRYSMNVESNPDQNVGDFNQFAVDSNRLNAFIDLEIPLQLSADGLTLSDTIEFSSANVEAPEEIISGTLYLIGYNGMPLSAGLRMKFYNASFVELAAIDFEDVLEPASSNVAGQSRATVKSVLEWDFTKQEIDDILASRYVIVEAVFDTDGESVRILDTDQLQFTLSGRFNYKYGQR